MAVIIEQRVHVSHVRLEGRSGFDAISHNGLSGERSSAKTSLNLFSAGAKSLIQRLINFASDMEDHS